MVLTFLSGFLFDCTPGRAAAEVCSFSPQISGLRHFAGGVFLGVIRGQFRVRKMPGGGPGFVQELLSHGADVEVLQPSLLRSRLGDIAKEMVALYNIP